MRHLHRDRPTHRRGMALCERGPRVGYTWGNDKYDMLVYVHIPTDPMM